MTPPAPPERSRALLVLVLGSLGMAAAVLGLVVLPVFLVPAVLAPAAWYQGSLEIAAIDAGRRPETGRSWATVGRTLGIAGTVLLSVGVFLVALFTLVFFVG